MITLDWTDQYDQLLLEAIVNGCVEGDLSGKPDNVVESGLAHVFFYGDTVYKLYKTHSDKDHFIKGVLAPTTKRKDFQEHDFLLNSHFSSSIYKNHHSLDYIDGLVTVKPYDGSTIYCLIEMSKLDFDSSLHEQLLRGEVNEDYLFELGYETAKAIDTCPIKVPKSVNWHDLAKARVDLLIQFINWMEDDYKKPVLDSGVLEALNEHLILYGEEYKQIKGDQLSVNVDNHDENVFFIDGKPKFIDLLPPMNSWWYGLPYANLSNLMINIEALYSLEAAQIVKNGYFDYHGQIEIPKHRLGFTHAFAHMISIAHFGTVPGKENVTKKYIDRLDEVLKWL